jgi:hypothetical protein
MKRHFRMLAGAIVGLLVAAPPLAALPLPPGFVSEPADVSTRDARSLAAPLLPRRNPLIRKNCCAG